ncbi:MAG: hypothetical protein IPL49_12380 [Saprospirales bacterium]|nr:hypothetical protein [Saprospirales bacterium]MBK8491647.1 hypothetical protein [Saprospirales bacterium]
MWVLFLCLAASMAQAQEEPSLLDLLGGEEETTEHVTNAFKSTRVVNGASMEMLGAGVLDFRILHRFGKFSLGAYQLFGLDNASMRLAFDYGVTPNLMVGVGRSTNKKEIDGFVKYRILWQSTGKKTMPISLLWVSGMTVNGLKDPVGNPEVEPLFRRRLAYYHQVIVGRKFSERFTLQLSPTMVHRNIVQNRLIPSELYAVGLGGRYKFSKRAALVWDYYYAINRFPNDPVFNPLTLGVDIETGGHVFQLHFSNAVGMNERAFITDDNGSWLKGDIQFGFNLSRVFQVVKPSF